MVVLESHGHREEKENRRSATIAKRKRREKSKVYRTVEKLQIKLKMPDRLTFKYKMRYKSLTMKQVAKNDTSSSRSEGLYSLLARNINK